MADEAKKVLVGNIKGPKGDKGEDGSPGAQGAQGIQGEPGPNLVNGDTSTTLTGVLFGDGSKVTSKPLDQEGGIVSYAAENATRAMLAPVESSGVASQAYKVGDFLVCNGMLYKVTAAIAQGGTIEPGTNVDASESLATSLQEVTQLCVESAEYPGCYYRTVGGVTEWLNPPMQLGVEYRTTERYNGKPVYTMTVNGGEMPAANQSAYITLTQGGVQVPVDHTVRITGELNRAHNTAPHMTIPLHDIYSNNTVATIGLELNGPWVQIWTDYNFSGVTWSATVWYTKSTD